MSDNWSVDETNPWASPKLTPSDGVDTHFDKRMQLTLKDMPNTEPDWKSKGGKKQIPLVIQGGKAI